MRRIADAGLRTDNMRHRSKRTIVHGLKIILMPPAVIQSEVIFGQQRRSRPSVLLYDRGARMIEGIYTRGPV